MVRPLGVLVPAINSLKSLTGLPPLAAIASIAAVAREAAVAAVAIVTVARIPGEKKGPEKCEQRGEGDVHWHRPVGKCDLK